MAGPDSKQTESRSENKGADKKLLSVPLKLPSVSLDIWALISIYQSWSYIYLFFMCCEDSMQFLWAQVSIIS